MDKRICILLVILVILIILLILVYIYSNKNNYDNIFKYSLMVNLKNDKISKQRLNKVNKIYNKYNLPINIMPALHYENDIEELNKLPIDKTVYDFNSRPGAYGLAGSFYKCLKKAYDNNWPYLLFLEDDAIPIKNNKEFYNELSLVLNTLPDNNDGIYILGFTIYCEPINNKIKGWKKKNELNLQNIAGTHSILFSKKSIHSIINNLKYNKIDRAIDNYIHKLNNVWFWVSDISKNGMFCGLYEQMDTNCNSRINIISQKSNLISIGVPCIFKHIEYLHVLINSINNQTLLPYEVIISISEINKLDELKLKNKLNKLSNVPLKIITTLDKKYAGENRNICANNCKTELISYIDADDELCPNRTEVLENIYNKNNYDVIYHKFSKNLLYCNSYKNIKVLNNIDSRKLIIFRKYKSFDVAYINISNIHHGHPTIKTEVMKRIPAKSEPRAQDVSHIYSLVNDKSDLNIMLLPNYIGTIYNSHLSSLNI